MKEILGAGWKTNSLFPPPPPPPAQHASPRTSAKSFSTLQPRNNDTRGLHSAHTPPSDYHSLCLVIRVTRPLVKCSNWERRWSFSTGLAVGIRVAMFCPGRGRDGQQCSVHSIRHHGPLKLHQYIPTGRGQRHHRRQPCPQKRKAASRPSIFR